MKKIIIILSFLAGTIFINLGMSAKAHINNIKDEITQLNSENLDMEQKEKTKEMLYKSEPVALTTEYGLIMNQTLLLESYSGTGMSIQLEDTKNEDDLSSQYVATEYNQVKGLKIQIVIDKFSKETDMGAVLDDIHLLEKNTDFLASEIDKDNNNLIVKGEIYGI